MIRHFEKLDFIGARKALDDILLPTNLIYSEYFSKKLDNYIYIKPENLQKTGSFKIRGAYNKIRKLSKEDRQRGLIASSAGNHAQGVAYAASELGAKATIVMPENTPLIKVDRTKSLGSEIVLSGNIYDEAYEKARQIAKEENLIFIHPFDDLDVIEGQGTIAVEILEELPDVDIILVPVGGGGLIAGIALFAKSINKDIQIIGVEPEGARCMKESLDNDCVTKLDFVDTIADGTAVGSPGVLNFDISKEYVDDYICVNDFELMKSFIELIEEHKLVAESSGLLSIAALRQLKVKNKKVVSLISGGNIDILSISTFVKKGLMYNGRIFKFGVKTINRPGQLAELTKILGDLKANIIEIDHDQYTRGDLFNDINLTITCETNGYGHISQIKMELKKLGYAIKELN